MTLKGIGIEEERITYLFDGSDMTPKKLLKCLHLVYESTVEKEVPHNDPKRRECITKVSKKDI